MKIIVLIQIVFFCICTCFAQDVTLNKIVEYPTGGVYFDKDDLCVKDQYLFAASIYGLEIYEVEPDSQAQLISRLPLLGDARVVEVKNNYAYVQSVSYYEKNTYIYKIDITDVYEPYIVKSIFVDNENGYAEGDIYNDFIIFRNWDEYYNYYYSIYRIPELEFVQNYFCNNLFRKLNDSLSLQRYSGEIFTLYDFSDLENISEICQVDFSAGGIPIDHIQPVNDSILACLDFDGIAFWNYLNIDNIQYLSTIHSPYNENWGNYLYNNGNFVFVVYIPYSGYPGLKSIDISNIFEPYVFDSIIFTKFLFFNTGLDLDGTENLVFTGEYNFINQVVCNDGYFDNQFTIYDNYQGQGGAIYDDYLYIIFLNGMKIYDVSSLPDVVHVNTIFEEHVIYSLQRVGNLLFLLDYTSYSIIVLDLTDPVSPNVRNEIPIPQSNGDILLSNTDECLYFKEDWPNYTLIKYSIPEPDYYTVDFQYDLDYEGNGFIYNDHFYYIAENSNGPDLQIFEGLEENDPELIMTIEDFAEGYYGAYIQNCDSIFYLGSWDISRDSVRFYEIGEPTEITYKFSTPHRCDGYFFIDGNYLYTGGNYSHIYVFDLETACGLVEPISDYQDYGRNLYCVFNEINDNKYLYHFQRTAFSIYEIQGYGVDEDPEVVNDPIICSPNPFSTSTTISFSGKLNSHELSRLKIYNIKGQLVREFLPVAPSPGLPVSVTWDGRDESGKEVGTGVYFYKLAGCDEYIGKVVKLK